MEKVLNEQGLTHLWSKIEDKIAAGGGSSNPTAANVSFDNTGTGLEATNVQAALTEINTDLVGSEEVQQMIDTSTLEPLESPTAVDIVFKASEIYDGTSQAWLLSAVNNKNGAKIDFLLECDIEIPAEMSKNTVQIVYRTNGTVNYGEVVHFKKGHTYSFMLMTSNATYWTSMAEPFVRNSNRSEIPYGQPILVCPFPNTYPRRVYQVVDVTPVVADGNEVSY